MNRRRIPCHAFNLFNSEAAIKYYRWRVVREGEGDKTAIVNLLRAKQKIEVVEKGNLVNETVQEALVKKFITFRVSLLISFLHFVPA